MLLYKKERREAFGTRKNGIRWPKEWEKKRLLHEAVSYSTKDFIVSAALYFVSVALCLLLRRFDPNNDSSYVAMIFLLDVFLTAFLTDGYLFSILMAIVGVLSVDYIFTPPYWAISFTVAGFPLTFLVMLTISLVTATVTTRAGKLTIDYDKHQVLVDGVNARLTVNEYKIVALLGKYAGKVLTYDFIIRELWGPKAKTDNQILRVNMANIRRKIEVTPGDPEYIFTEVGVGYRMREGD